MHRPIWYLTFSAFLITMEVYRIPTPLGLNVAFYHLFFFLGLCVGIFAFLSRGLKVRLSREAKSTIKLLMLFACYSVVCFLRNISNMRAESRSAFLAELVGYMFVLSMPILAKRRSEVQRLIRAFLASALFVYLGAFWHLYNYAILGRYVTGIPFWKVYTGSEHVIEYIEAEATFAQFPRFRLPFSSPAGTGLFLALEGIFLVALSLLDISRLKRRGLMLIVLNLINLFCLLGTFARASWAVFFIGCLVVIISLKRVRLVALSKITFGVLFYISACLILIASIPVAKDFSYMVGLRLSPSVTEASNLGHLESRQLALKYWTESPIIGIGVGGFWTRPRGGIHTHSTYFSILVERGAVGLLLFLAFLIQLIRAVLKEVRSIGKHNRERGTPYNVAFLAGIVGLMIGGLLYEINCEMAWMFLALALSWINAPREAEPAKNKSEVHIADTRKGIMQQALTRSVPRESFI